MTDNAAFEVADRIRDTYESPTAGEKAAVQLAALARKLQAKVDDLEHEVSEMCRRAQGPMYR